MYRKVIYQQAEFITQNRFASVAEITNELKINSVIHSRKLNRNRAKQC
jgi:hypothetical protein